MSSTATTSTRSSRTSVTSRTSRRSQTTCIVGTKLECAAQAKIVAQRRRIPLATKSNVNGNVAASTRISLPRTLPRPEVGEVDMSSLVDAYPHLEGIPADYVRDTLALSAPKMCAALQATQTSVCKSALPQELQILMNDTVAAACPTHMLAVYNDVPLSLGQKRQVSLFPIHDIVLGMHCSRLPRLPFSRPSTTASHATIPVVPIRLPSPETFALLHAYLYTQQPATLFASLERPCGNDILRLAAHANKIQGLWRNACTLGVVDAPLYEAIEASWDSTIAAMQACS